MSFFPTEKREIHNNTIQQFASVGPGKYEHQSIQKNRRQQGYAPFGSLTTKQTRKSQQIHLGPGQYNISSSISKPSITKYENKNIIIVKINDEGGHQFKSRSNRFKDVETSPIGPGSYYRTDSSSIKKRVMSSSLHRPKLADKVRMINQQFHSKRQPTLLSDPPQVHETLENNQPTKSKGVLNWSLNKKQRFDPLIKQNFTEEDKRKALSDFNNTRKKISKPTAVFASKSIKSHFETQIYKTNNSFKAQLRKMIDFKDQNPGPGSYEPIKSPNHKILQKFQFFGSTVQRFPVKEDEMVGPGSYELQKKKSQPQNKENHYSYSEQRHSYLPKSMIPGPGSYEVKGSIIHNSFSQNQLQTAFGTQQPRFVERYSEEKAEVQSSFGTNNLKEREARRERQLKILKKISEDHASSVFTSKTNRFIRTKTEGQHPEIGTYDITQNDINARIQKQQKLIKQLEDCQLSKPPFLSSNQRFKEIKVHQSEHKNCWCQVKSVQKQMIEHQSPVFISGEPRTTVFQQQFKAPPVGFYQSSDGNMIRNSFNSRFKKQNENRIKKDLALRKGNKSNKQLKKEEVQKVQKYNGN